MSLIFFLIYINKVLNKILEISSLVISLSFIDDLGFIVLGSLKKDIIKVLEKIAKKVIE